MAGVIGTRKFAYDVWGDTVNIAARIEAASQPNRVLISATTAKMLPGLDGFKPSVQLMCAILITETALGAS
jgi:class 3 adenylate cyclase